MLLFSILSDWIPSFNNWENQNKNCNLKTPTAKSSLEEKCSDKKIYFSQNTRPSGLPGKCDAAASSGCDKPGRTNSQGLVP